MSRPHKIWYRSARYAWYVEIDGEQKKLVKGENDAATRKLAEQKFHALMAEHLACVPVDNGNPTVLAVIEAFLAHDEKQSKERTYYERKRYLQLFTEARGRLLVKECKVYHLTSWLDEHPEWLNPWTRSYAIRCVKRPFNWAVQQDLLERNPFGKVPPGKGDPRRCMTPQEFGKLLMAAREHQMTGLIEVLRFLYIVGCRPEVVRHLRWDHVQWHRQMIVIDKPADLKLLKVRKRLRLSLAHPSAFEILRTIQGRNDHPEYVFVTRLRKPWSRNGIQQHVRRLRREAGLAEDVVTYGLRHSWATRGVRSGAPIKHVSMGMGHSKVSTTDENYTHLDDDIAILHQTMLRVNGLRPGACKPSP